MDLKKRIKESKKLISEKEYNSDQLIEYYIQNNIFHTVAIILYSKVFNISIEDSSKIIYTNKFYSFYKEEANPFNSDFLKSDEKDCHVTD